MTLVTCTPYGVNTHRLLVRGKRVEYDEEARLIITADATPYSTFTVSVFIAVPILVIIFIIFMIRTSKRFK